MAGESGQKTEKPTPKRLREAREKGQIARSPDLATWVEMLAATVLVQVVVSRASDTFPATMHEMRRVAERPDAAEATRFATNAAWDAVGVIAPLLLGLMVTGIVVGFSQVGLQPSLKRLKPEFKRLNPLQGLKRMVSVSAWWDIGKALAKTVVLFVVAWPAATGMVETFTTRAGDSLPELAGLTASTCLDVLRNVAVAGLAIAVGDYLWQRRRLTKQLSMTRQEVREELKQQEGNPEMRRAMRSRQTAMSRNRMIRLVGTADAVVVNPTHYAVALRYRAERGAPEVVAKGAGAIATRIRAEAVRTGVPIVHEPILTRALFKACDIGDVIPRALYEAVAHLLAFVFGMKARGRGPGYHELPQPVRL